MKRILLALAVLLASTLAQNAQQPTPPPYCKPCLWYGGDFDPSNPNADSLGNSDTLAGQLTTYVPFYVPDGREWTIIGVFSNNLSDIQYINPQQLQWSISTGVSAGNAGTVIASGTTPHATWTPTGRSFQGLTEYTVLGRLTPETTVTLTSGVYWMTAVPVCTKQIGYCEGAIYQLTDVEDIPAPNHKGVQPNDDSYYSAPNGQLYYVPAWGASGACGGIGCDRFSAGLLGYARPSN